MNFHLHCDIQHTCRNSFVSLTLLMFVISKQLLPWQFCSQQHQSPSLMHQLQIKNSSCFSSDFYHSQTENVLHQQSTTANVKGGLTLLLKLVIHSARCAENNITQVNHLSHEVMCKKGLSVRHKQLGFKILRSGFHRAISNARFSSQFGQYQWRSGNNLVYLKRQQDRNVIKAPNDAY